MLILHGWRPEERLNRGKCMINVAILGYGTVGSGVFKIINENNSHISNMELID